MSSSADKSERASGGNSHRVAFDRFELDLRSGELHKDGRKIRLQAQPFQLLAMLIENAGEASDAGRSVSRPVAGGHLC